MMARILLLLMACMGAAAVVSEVLPFDGPGGWVGFGAVLLPMALLVMTGDDDGAWPLALRRLGYVLQAILALIVAALGGTRGGMALGFAALTVVSTALLLPMPGRSWLPPEDLARRRLREGRARPVDLVVIAGGDTVFVGCVGIGFTVAALTLGMRDDPVTGAVIGAFFGAAALFGIQQTIEAVSTERPEWGGLARRLQRSALSLFSLSLVAFPLADLDAPRLVAYGIAAFGLLGLVAVVFGRTPTAGSDTHWVASRDGLVEFSPHGTRLFAWDDVMSARADGAGARVEVRAGAVPEVYRLGEGHGGPTESLWIPPEQLVGVERDAFVAMLEAARSDPAVRALLPTFAHPDGPPEAVLADLDR